MSDIQSITYNSRDGEAGWNEFKAKADNLCSQNYEPYNVITNSQIVGSSETIEFRQTDVEWEFYAVHWLLHGEDEFDGVGHFMQDQQAEGWSLVGSIDRRTFFGQSLVPFLPDLLGKHKSIYFKRKKYQPETERSMEINYSTSKKQSFHEILSKINSLNDINKIKEYIDIENFLSFRNNDGDTPLLYSVRYKKTEFVKLCIQLGSNLEEKNSEDLTPLAKIITDCWGDIDYEELDIIKLLLENGADPNFRYKDGMPLITNVCQQDFYEKTYLIKIFELLTEHGADVNLRCFENNWTPLHYACNNGGYQRNIHWLCAHGAEVDAKDERGRTPLFIMADESTVDMYAVMELMRWGANVDETDNNGRTARAVIESHVKDILDDTAGIFNHHNRED